MKQQKSGKAKFTYFQAFKKQSKTLVQKALVASSMIHFVNHKNIDKNQWDNCLQKSINNTIIVSSAYLDCVCDNWNALILNNYEAVFPLVERSKYNIKYLYQPFFSRYLGLYSNKSINEKTLNEFVKAIPEYYKYLDFCMHESNTFLIENVKINERKFQVLDLGNSYEHLYKGYSENVKRNLKKASKVHFTIHKNITPAAIVALFKKNKGGELAVFSNADYQRLLKLMNHFFANKKAISIGIYKENELCAAGFFIIDNEKLLYLKGAVNEFGKANGAMQLLMDEVIKSNGDLKKQLDFGGSSVDSVARFYKSFGAKDCIYLQIKQNNLPKFISWIKK
jgi:hypothetical protein